MKEESWLATSLILATILLFCVWVWGCANLPPIELPQSMPSRIVQQQIQQDQLRMQLQWQSWQDQQQHMLQQQNHDYTH